MILICYNLNFCKFFHYSRSIDFNCRSLVVNSQWYHSYTFFKAKIHTLFGCWCIKSAETLNSVGQLTFLRFIHSVINVYGLTHSIKNHYYITSIMNIGLIRLSRTGRLLHWVTNFTWWSFHSSNLCPRCNMADISKLATRVVI